MAVCIAMLIGSLFGTGAGAQSAQAAQAAQATQTEQVAQVAQVDQITQSAQTALTAQEAQTAQAAQAEAVDASPSGATGSGSLDSTWTIVVGSDPLEQTAASDLQLFLSSRFGIQVAGPVSAASYAGATHGILIGTTADNGAIAAENSRRPFRLNAAEPESYHDAYRLNGSSENVWLVGESAKGAMNGAFRFEDKNTSSVASLDEQASPAFENRIGGHLMVQSPPPGFTEDQQAAYYAHNYINVVWGEKYGPPLSYAARHKYGLGLALEVKLPPASDAWMTDPAHASAVYWRDSWSGKRKVISPFDPVGRQAYLDAFNQAIANNPDTKILYSLFGDYSFTTDESSVRISDGTSCACTSESSVLEVMNIMKEAIGSRDITPAVWMWHLDPKSGDEAFMQQLESLGYGIIYNENSNNDDWMYKRNNFNSLALKTDSSGSSEFGSDYMVLVSAGGTGESVDPAIGVPLPHVAASKIRKLADAHIKNFLLWWGSSEGWVYSANMSAIREMIWNPNLFNPANPDPFNPAAPDALMSLIAQRDFDPALAPSILDFWKQFDAAVVDKSPSGAPSGIQAFSWNQRLGVFTLPNVFGGGYPVPLIPSELANKQRFNLYYPWGIQQTTLDNFGQAAAKMGDALNQAWNLRMSTGDSSQSLKDMQLWGSLFKRVFASQYNMLRALQIAEKYRAADGSLDIRSDALRQELTPVVQDELDNTNATIGIVQQFPSNFSLSGSSRDSFDNNGNRDKDVQMLQGKAASMQIWLDNLNNLAVNTPVTASSAVALNRVAGNAVDGDAATLWHSNYNDAEWTYTDLGSVQPVRYVKLNWNPSAAAQQYRIEVASDLSGANPWTVVSEVVQSSGAVDLITLPANTAARYVKMQGIKRATSYGYALNELEVYGAEAAEVRSEAESLPAAVSPGDSHAPFSDANMSGGAGDKLNANGDGDYVEYTVPIPQAGAYRVLVGVKKQASRGIAQLSIGGVNLGAPQDTYAAADSYAVLDMGLKAFTAGGSAPFRFTVTGKNAASTGYTLGIDYVKLVPVHTAVFEAESLPVTVSSGDSAANFMDAGASAGAASKLNAAGAGSYVEYTVRVPQAAKYDVRVVVKKQASRGIAQLKVGGMNVGAPQDNYAAADQYVELDLGTKTFVSAGSVPFRFTVTGKNAASTGYSLGIDAIRLIPAP